MLKLLKMKYKTIKAELTIPTAVYSNLKPVIEIEVPENLNGVELVQYLWDTYHNIFERPVERPRAVAKETKAQYWQRINADSDRERSMQAPVAGFSEEEERVMRIRGKKDEGAGIKNVEEVF